MTENTETTERANVPYCLLAPEKAIGGIIGPKGETIQGIQTKSETSIDVAKRHEAGGFGEKLIVIKGDTDQKVTAVKELAGIIYESNEDEDDKSKELVLLIPATSVPLVIGSRGAKIKELQNDSGCTIDVSKSGIPGRCSLKGDENQIMEALNNIYEVVETDKRGATNFVPQAQVGAGAPYGDTGYGGGAGYGGGGKSFGKGGGYKGKGGGASFGAARRQVDWHMVIPASCSSAIIGARGSVVNDIQNRSGSVIDIPKDGGHDGDKTIVIRGDDHQKSYGLDLILHQLAQCREFQQAVGGHAPPIRFRINGNSGGKLVGPGGQTVQHIAQKTNTRIDVGREPYGPDGEYRCVNVSGDVNGIVAVALAIFQVV